MTSRAIVLAIVGIVGSMTGAHAGTYYSKVCGTVQEIAPIAGPVFVPPAQAVHTPQFRRGNAGTTRAEHELAKALSRTVGEQATDADVVRSMQQYGVIASAPFSEKRIEARESVTHLCVGLASGGLTHHLEDLSLGKLDKFREELDRAEAEVRQHVQ